MEARLKIWFGDPILNPHFSQKGLIQILSILCLHRPPPTSISTAHCHYTDGGYGPTRLLGFSTCLVLGNQACTNWLASVTACLLVDWWYIYLRFYTRQGESNPWCTHEIYNPTLNTLTSQWLCKTLDNTVMCLKTAQTTTYRHGIYVWKHILQF